MTTPRDWGPRIAVAVTLAAVAGATFLLPAAEPVEPLFNRLNGVAFATVGLLASRRPEGRRIGWLCLAIGLSGVLFDLSAGYAATQRPGAVWAYWFGEWVSVVQPVLLLIVLPALFPTGRPLSRRWGWPVPLGLLALLVAATSVMTATDTYEVDEAVLGPNPLGTPALDAFSEWAFIGAVFVAFACAVGAMISLVVRFRRSGGVERLQLRWLLSGIGILIALSVATAVIGGLSSATLDRVVSEALLDGIFGAATLVLPAAIGIALTRYRLYELDRLVSRTVAYAVIVALLVATYAGLVVGLGAAARAVTGEAGDVVVAVSTLAVAALTRPVHHRVRATVDRRFNRARYDAGRTIDAFGRRLRDEVSLDAIVAATRSTVGAAVQPASVGLTVIAATVQSAPRSRP